MNPLHIRQHLLPDMRTRVKKKFNVYGKGIGKSRYYNHQGMGCEMHKLFIIWKLWPVALTSERRKTNLKFFFEH